MKLYVSRHGEASFDAESDYSRPLTDRGITQTRRLLEEHIEELKTIRSIWASPLLRAQQTAKIYADVLACEVQTQTFLTPDSSPASVLRQLEKVDSDQLLLVSHQPLVGELASFLLEGNLYSSHPFITSELVVFECELMAPGMASIVADYMPT